MILPTGFHWSYLIDYSSDLKSRLKISGFNPKATSPFRLLVVKDMWDFGVAEDTETRDSICRTGFAIQMSSSARLEPCLDKCSKKSRAPRDGQDNGMFKDRRYTIHKTPLVFSFILSLLLIQPSQVRTQSACETKRTNCFLDKVAIREQMSLTIMST